MANRSPEQDLIDTFMKLISNHSDGNLCVDKIYSHNCKARKFADIEFTSKSGLLWVIEAKSDDSKDKYNTVHKIFGELLKETGRVNRDQCRYALLIPKAAVQFYSRGLQVIHRDKFVGFGKLIPIDTVFACGHSSFYQMTWNDLYDGINPRK